MVAEFRGKFVLTRVRSYLGVNFEPLNNLEERRGEQRVWRPLGANFTPGGEQDWEFLLAGSLKNDIFFGKLTLIEF
jgi:hypothetical protein